MHLWCQERGFQARGYLTRAATTTSILRRRGVIALITVGSGALGTVFWVHRIQTRERQTMRQAVYRDIEKLEKLEKQNAATK